MPNNVMFLLISVILVVLGSVLIVLFKKHLKSMNIFVEEIRKEQEVLHNEINQSNQQNNKKKNKKTQVKPNNKKVNNKNNMENLNSTKLKSSKVSQKELSELIKGKKQVFKKEVPIKPGDVFVDLNIDIDKNMKR